MVLQPTMLPVGVDQLHVLLILDSIVTSQPTSVQLCVPTSMVNLLIQINVHVDQQDVLILMDYIVLLSKMYHVLNHIAMLRNGLLQIIGIAIRIQIKVVVFVVMVVLCQLLPEKALGMVTKLLVF